MYIENSMLSQSDKEFDACFICGDEIERFESDLNYVEADEQEGERWEYYFSY